MISLKSLVASAFMAVLAAPAMAQDGSMDPNYGSLSLSENFRPNPHQVSIVAGGDMQASETLSGCVGWITRQPDFKLTYTSGSAPLTISVNATADTTLIIQSPDGRWNCNDDADGFNPIVSFTSPYSGLYAIWVGSYIDEDVEAVLSFSQ